MFTPLCPHFFRPPRNMHTIIMDKFRCSNCAPYAARRQFPIEASYISEDEWNFIRSFSGEMFKNYLLMRELQQKSGLSTKLVQWLLQADFDTPVVKPKIVRRRRKKRKNFVKKSPSVPFTKVFDCWETNIGTFEIGPDVASAGMKQNFAQINNKRAPITETYIPHAAMGREVFLMRHGGMKLCDDSGRCITLPMPSEPQRGDLFGFTQDAALLQQNPTYIRLREALMRAGEGLYVNRPKLLDRNVLRALGAQTFNGKPGNVERFDAQRAPADFLLSQRRKTLSAYFDAAGFDGGAGDFAHNGGRLNRKELEALIANYASNGNLKYDKHGARPRIFEAAKDYRYIDPRQGHTMQTSTGFELVGNGKYLDLRQGRAIQNSTGFEIAGNGKYLDPRQGRNFQTSIGFDLTATGKYSDPRQGPTFQTANGNKLAGNGKYLDPRQQRPMQTSTGFDLAGNGQGHAFQTSTGFEFTGNGKYLDPRQGHAFQTSTGFEFAGNGKYLDPRQGRDLQTSTGFEFAGNGQYLDTRPGRATQTPTGLEFDGNGKYLDPRQRRPSETATPQYAAPHQFKASGSGGDSGHKGNEFIHPRHIYAFEAAGGEGGGQARLGSANSIDGFVSYGKKRVTMEHILKKAHGQDITDLYTGNIENLPIVAGGSMFLNSDNSERISSQVTRGSYKRPDWTHSNRQASQGQPGITPNVYKRPNWRKLMQEERLKNESSSASQRQLKEKSSLERDEEFGSMVEDLDAFYSIINTSPLIPETQGLVEDLPSGDTELNLKDIINFLKKQNQAEFYPVVYHEPFDRFKPWTWMQKFPTEIPKKYLDRVSKHSLHALKAWQRLQNLIVDKNQQFTIEKKKQKS